MMKTYDFGKLTAQLDSYLEMGLPFYDCIVFKDGACVYRRMNGYTDVKNKVKPNGKELYNIYSCSKTITCAAALQLWERGLYSLDDKLSDYMPEFSEMTLQGGTVAAKNPILIRHLFEMTAGLSYRLSSPELIRCKEETGGRCPTRETMKYLAGEPLDFEPGERWQYSLCHDVLAALVEVLSGERFGEYVRKNIFEPLQMENSTFAPDAPQRNAVVNQYVFDREKGVIERDRKNYYLLGTEYESGGAGCVSTVEDYIKFAEALRVGGRVLKPETVDLMATNRLTKEQLKSYWIEDYGYGLGQRVPKDSTRSDFGWGGAAGAYCAIDKKHGFTLYFGTHILGYGELQIKRRGLVFTAQEILG